MVIDEQTYGDVNVDREVDIAHASKHCTYGEDTTTIRVEEGICRDREEGFNLMR